MLITRYAPATRDILCNSAKIRDVQLLCRFSGIRQQAPRKATKFQPHDLDRGWAEEVFATWSMIISCLEKGLNKAPVPKNWRSSNRILLICGNAHLDALVWTVCCSWKGLAYVPQSSLSIRKLDWRDASRRLVEFPFGTKYSLAIVHPVPRKQL